MEACSACGGGLPANARYCPACGAAVGPAAANPGRTSTAMAGWIAAGWVLLGLAVASGLTVLESGDPTIALLAAILFLGALAIGISLVARRDRTARRTGIALVVSSGLVLVAAVALVFWIGMMMTAHWG